MAAPAWSSVCLLPDRGQLRTRVFAETGIAGEPNVLVPDDERGHDVAPFYEDAPFLQLPFRHKGYPDSPPLVDDAIADAYRDEQLLEQVEELGIQTARLRQLLGQLKANVNPETYAVETDNLIAGMKASNSDQIRAAVNRLAELRTETRDDDRTWNQILRLIERKRRLVESQRKRIQELDLVVSRAQVVRFATLLLEAVTRNVADPEVLKQVSDEFRAVTGRIRGDGTIH